jgi:glutamyl-tRNA synthetase
MVDDHLMEISHVIRGSEWLPTFPLHGHILRAFGWDEPVFVHLSLFLKPSGKGKMSKREADDALKDGYSIYLQDLRQLGYLPEAVVNWAALMGWSYDDRTEFFTLDDLVEKFTIDRLNASPAAINFTKLDHFNGLHIRHLDSDDLAQRIKPFMDAFGLQADLETLRRIAPIIQERIATLDDAVDMAGFFFREEVKPQAEELVGKKMTPESSAEAARRTYELLATLPGVDHDSANEPLRALAEELGLKAGQLFGIIRAAVTGQKVSPPLFESMEIIGKEKVLSRMMHAVEVLEGI